LNHGPHSGEFNSSSENVAKSPYLKDKGKWGWRWSPCA
jgi:hypothetical protein